MADVIKSYLVSLSATVDKQSFDKFAGAMLGAEKIVASSVGGITTSGSGSTLIASTKMQRRCYLMEKSPVYAEVILNRWSKATGLTPKKI